MSENRPQATTTGPGIDEESFERAAEDFGHLISRRPAAVHRPKSARGVADAVRWAAGRGMPMAVRGQGHSVYGRAQVQDGLVIDTSALHAVHVTRPDRVVAEAGATWQSVLDATLPHGLTPPTLTDYVRLSVGGTISAGGLGGATFRHGFQSCNVLELDVVTGDGEIVTCSASRHPRLFHAVRAGHGQFGVITKAVVPLIPAPERVRLHTLYFPDIRTMMAAQRRLLAADRVDYLEGAIRPDGPGWQYVVEAAVGCRADSRPDDAALADAGDECTHGETVDLSFGELYQRLSKLEAHLREVGAWHHAHPWLNTFLPDSTAEQVMTELLAEVAAHELGEFGRILLYPIVPGRARTPLMRLPEEDVAFVCNFIRFPADDPVLADKLVVANRAIYERVRSAGGYLYPVSAVALTQADWQAHYGRLWPTVEDAKTRFDPGHLLSPGHHMFA
ncbi:FAD-binding protein [Nonomuraea sp. NPDC050404]|uniref:FAD-binding protein n=1 Tax=Nonomuraea sp. NPDC050404 TaxID=3155783 RepID=UPI0033D8D131